MRMSKTWHLHFVNQLEVVAICDTSYTVNYLPEKWMSLKTAQVGEHEGSRPRLNSEASGVLNWIYDCNESDQSYHAWIKCLHVFRAYIWLERWIKRHVWSWPSKTCVFQQFGYCKVSWCYIRYLKVNNRGITWSWTLFH